ncbi:RHS repeat-associated core domain-containing protein [bacterium]|nr:RHS repeat-associated core domain-containing protein [bacterium]
MCDNTDSWGGLYIHRDSAIDVSDYETLSFAVHGGSTGGQYLVAELYDDDDEVIDNVVVTDYISGGSIAANTWYEVDIPLEDFNIGQDTVGGVVIMSDDTTTIYVDEIRFEEETAGQGGSGTTITYAYDHEGNRISYSDGTVTTVYPNKYYNTDGNTKTKHIFANNQLIATIEANGVSTSTYNIYTDHLGGSSVVTDEDGTVVQLLDYYPFGDQRMNEKEGSFDEQRKFTGHEYDDDTELSYMVARYQDGAMGRFISIDPLVNDLVYSSNYYGIETGELLADPQRLNSYSYVSNNPLLYNDPFGLDKVIFYGGNKENPSYFRDIAYQSPQQMVQSGETEPVYVKEGSSPQQWQNTLNSTEDISYIGYYGHGFSEGLYLGNVGKNYSGGNKPSSQGTASIMTDKLSPGYDPNTDITVGNLPTKNIGNNLKIELYSCYAGSAGSRSIANAFSQHFNAPATGAQGGVNFTEQGEPYVRYRHRSPLLWFAPWKSPWKTFDDNN